MKNYFSKNYQDSIISQHGIDEQGSYLYHIASIQNIALSNFKVNCVLNGCDAFIVDKTNNNLVFFVSSGKLLTNIIFSFIESPLIIDTHNSISFLTVGVLLNTDGIKVRCFLVDINRIWNPEGEIFDPRHLIFYYVQLVHYQNKFRVYGPVFDNNYLKTLDTLGIQYNPRISEVGYSPMTENYRFSIFGLSLDIRPLLIVNEQRIRYNFRRYLRNTYPAATTTKLIPDISTYSMRQERVTRQLSVFDGFYNDFGC